MPGKNKARKNKFEGKTQRDGARTIDALIEFDEFNKKFLPELRKMVLEDWSLEKIRKHFAPMIQALAIQKAMSGSERMIKDLLDRHEGMAIQRVEQKTLHAQMSKKELAALCLQKLLDAKVIDTTGRVIKEAELVESDNEQEP